MITIGIIGYGHWGPNHLRLFSTLPGSNVLACADPDPESRKRLKANSPEVDATEDYMDILRNEDIQAVCVTTPTSTHYEIVKKALKHGKDVLCEKPITLTAAEADDLVMLADKENRILMVGHVFLFNSGIKQLKYYVDSGLLGDIQYGYSTRTNLGPFRYDVNAVQDLASHDISIFNHLFGTLPREVSARGHKCLSTQREDLAFITLIYPDNIFINLHVSWLDPKKVRQITMVGKKKMVCWDDLDRSAPIRIYDKRVERGSLFYQSFGEFQLLSKEGEVTIPEFEQEEPLRSQNEFFLNCVSKRIQPEIADGKKGWEAVKVLEAIQESIDQGGIPVKLI